MPEIRKSADISACGRYRYRLTRHWDPHARPLTFIMLNPSTADAAVEDATIRRCIRFARRERAGGIVVMNLYAFRTTDPRQLHLCPDPDGPENICLLKQVAVTNSPVVCAWGVWGGERGAFVAGHMLRQGAHLVCLGVTKGGHPKHPLYVRADQPLITYPR